MKKTVIFLIVLYVCCVPQAAFGVEALDIDAGEQGVAAVDACFVEGTNFVNELFSSELPLIILEGPDLDMEGSVGESLPASMRTVDSMSENRIDDEPSYTAEVAVEVIRYENDNPRPKKDYFISVAGDKKPQVAPMSGLDVGDRWLLLGGAYDKSLIRNYLGYTLAGRILDNAPDVRLCELLLEHDGYYEYQGVYLLVEGSVSDGSVIARRTEHYWEGFNQTVVYDKDMGVFVLQEGWGGSNQVAQMGGAIEAVADMFASTNTNDYLRYSSILDMESFYAYFLLNELMANYEGMNESIYSYDPVTQKISIGPFWNFESALDNRKDEPIELRRLIYQNTPFYSHMIIDSEFVNGLINASKDNAAQLSGIEFKHLVNQAVEEIGQAQERDWYRWQFFYLSEENALNAYIPSDADNRISARGIGYDERGALMVETAAYYSQPGNAPERARQFKEYDQEILKLKYFAYERPAYVRKAILLFKNQDELLTKVNEYGQNSLWAILFLIGFILSIILARRTAER